MPDRCLLLGSPLLALLALAPVAAATAQPMTPTPVPSWSTTARQLETFYTQYRLTTRGSDVRVRTGGMGGRLMWRLPAGDDTTTLRSRTSVGVAATYARRHLGPTLTAQYLAVESEVGLLPSPLLGRLSPFVGLGAGALRVDTTPLEAAWFRDSDHAIVSFVVAPSVGTRLELGRGLGLRGEVRDLITFDGGMRHNTAVGVGLSLTF